MKNLVGKIRKEKGLTRWALAKKANLDPATLYKIERNQIFFYPGWRKRIAEALGVSEAELFEEGNDGTEPGLE